VDFATASRSGPKQIRIEVVYKFQHALPFWSPAESFGVYIGGHKGTSLIKQIEVWAAEPFCKRTKLNTVITFYVTHCTGISGFEDCARSGVVLVELDLDLVTA